MAHKRSTAALVDVGSPLKVIATDVDLIMAFAIPRPSLDHPADRDGDFGDENEIRVFGET